MTAAICESDVKVEEKIIKCKMPKVSKDQSFRKYTIGDNKRDESLKQTESAGWLVNKE